MIQKKLKETANRLGITTRQIPQHIAIIMDGNGRWAKQRSLPRVEGHRQGAKTAVKIAQYCSDFGIKSLTLYSFSMENWKRPKAEVDALMDLYTQYLAELRPNLMKNNVKLIHLGRLDGLPDTVKTELTNTIEKTSSNTGMILGLALNYGSRTEIIDATRQIALKYKKGQLRLEDIDELCISRHLYTTQIRRQKTEDRRQKFSHQSSVISRYGFGLRRDECHQSSDWGPDLLIRTANEMRISNFLLWQISYSEFYVTKTLWPNFNKANLEKAIRAFAKRDRRFGSIQNQNVKRKNKNC
jgi:undecaprenyl diphosphate synthase